MCSIPAQRSGALAQREKGASSMNGARRKTMSASEVAEALGGAIAIRLRNHSHKVRCHCPAHDDRSSNLFIEQTRGTGTIRFHCGMGCTQPRVIEAIRGKGITLLRNLRSEALRAVY